MIEGSFYAAVGFQYQRGPRIGILIRGGVSNKGELSVKDGVQLRHTTMPISTRIKKAAQTKEGSFSWTKGCSRDMEGRRDVNEKREDYLVVKGGQDKSFAEMVGRWIVTEPTVKECSRFPASEDEWWTSRDEMQRTPPQPIHTHPNKRTLTQTDTVARGFTSLPSPSQKTKQKTTKLFPFIPRFQALKLARKAH